MRRFLCGEHRGNSLPRGKPLQDWYSLCRKWGFPVNEADARDRTDAPCGDDPMLHVVLFQPEIPPNTGNIIRLCANTGSRLHLVGPLGFSLDDARLKRAGLDYHELAHTRTYRDWSSYLEQNPERPTWAFSTRGKVPYSDAAYGAGDALLFGPETRGLPQELLERFPEDRRLRLPMVADSRSLNLSNTVAIAVYEALRQLGFQGLA
jgi:tRNA (cytidine/uridine-2'-O-)-methyltransferase